MKPAAIERAASALAVFGAAAAAWALFHFDPARGGYPPCPTHLLTGLHCPGCGSLRALHFLLHGNATAATSQNALAVALLPVPLWALADRIGVALGRRLPAWRAPRWAPALLLGAFAVFTVARNLPFWPLSWLAPE